MNHSTAVITSDRSESDDRNLLSTCLEDDVLLTLVDATFSRRPKLQHNVLLFQQLVQRDYTMHTQTSTTALSQHVSE